MRSQVDVWYQTGIRVVAALTAIVALLALFNWGARGATVEPRAGPIEWGPWSHRLPGIKVSGMPAPADWRLERTYVRTTVSAPHTECVAYAKRDSIGAPWMYEFAMGFEPEWLENMNVYEAAWKSCAEDPPTQ